MIPKTAVATLFFVILTISACSQSQNTIDSIVIEKPSQESACTNEYAPVCGLIQPTCPPEEICTSTQMTFQNACHAKQEDAEILYVGECETDTVNLEVECLQAKGRWIQSAQECEYIEENTCLELGGRFEFCASPCRNDPNVEVCIDACVAVCEFR